MDRLKNFSVLKLPSQSPDLHPTKTLQQFWKIAFYKDAAAKMSDLGKCEKKNEKKSAVSKCAKLLQNHHKNHATVTEAKAGFTKH